MEMNGVHLIYKNDGSGQFPMFPTTDGTKAVVIFKTFDAAKRFTDGKNKQDEWMVVEQSWLETLAWLRDCMSRENATLMSIDPNPDTFHNPDETNAIPILRILIEAEPD
jgi:hypothetical protein